MISKPRPMNLCDKSVNSVSFTCVRDQAMCREGSPGWLHCSGTRGKVDARRMTAAGCTCSHAWVAQQRQDDFKA